MKSSLSSPAMRILLSALVVVAACAPALADEFWPKTLSGEKGEIVVYQPQLESLEGQLLEARAAVMVSPADAGAPVFGAMWFAARLATDQDTRLASLEAVTVTAARFPDLGEDRVANLSRFLEQDIPRWDLTFSIDRIIAELAAEEQSLVGDAGIKHDPPIIHVRDHPAVLVVIDGDPIFQDLDGPPLEFVVNSAFFMVRESGQQPIYLRGSGMWFTAQELAGPWSVAGDLPAAVTDITPQLEAEEAKQAEAAAADADALDLKPSPDEAAPEIIVTTVPAELIVTDGEPDFASVAGTQLLYLENTETDVIMDIAGQQYFVLIAGRWYRSASLENGPWTYVDPDGLPADFAAIPAGSDLAAVLPSVGGTQAAREAVLDSQIPQTAEIDRKTATCTVTYDGDPEFESCATGVAYARNTDKSVLLIDGTYYCCDAAVWFVSARPDGPWTVATELPAVIQELPPECPVYNVKYVYIYDTTPEVVYVGYTAGYYHSYVYHGCVLYGSGWWYRPWYRHHYYPRPVTYGFGVHYNPWTGWGFSYGVSYGWVSVGFHWGRYPYRGWGPAGYRGGYRHGYWRGYNHGYRHGYRRGAAAGYRAGDHAGQRNPSTNIYRNRPTGVKRTGDVNRPHRKAPATSDRKNNVYTDRDGNVYRDRDGSWEKREGGRWEADKERPETRERDRQQRDQQQRDQMQRDRQQRDRQQLDRDRSARDRGAQRQRQAPQRQPRQRSGGRSGGRGGRG